MDASLLEQVFEGFEHSLGKVDQGVDHKSDTADATDDKEYTWEEKRISGISQISQLSLCSDKWDLGFDQWDLTAKLAPSNGEMQVSPPADESEINDKLDDKDRVNGENSESSDILGSDDSDNEALGSVTDRSNSSVGKTSASDEESVDCSPMERIDLDLSNVKMDFAFNMDMFDAKMDLPSLSQFNLDIDSDVKSDLSDEKTDVESEVDSEPEIEHASEPEEYEEDMKKDEDTNEEDAEQDESFVQIELSDIEEDFTNEKSESPEYETEEEEEEIKTNLNSATHNFNEPIINNTEEMAQDVLNDKTNSADKKPEADNSNKLDLTFDWSFLEVEFDTNEKNAEDAQKNTGHLGSLEDNRNLDDQHNHDDPPTSPTARNIVENKQLITEMRSQNYDVIRFATYRTACKLRYLQKRTNLHLVDIWNMIESFRENGLNSMDNNEIMTTARLELLLSSIIFHLNKRLPNSSQIDAERSVTMLHSWLLSAYDPDCQGRVRVFSVKLALATLSSGKLMDKLRYIFTLIADGNGHMMWAKFEDYLREVLALPTAVFEKPSFGYNESAARACFDLNKTVTVNDFLDTLMTEPGPQCLMWQPILNRMATVEYVRHPIQCEGCHRESFKGFRYKCERCYNYQLCQDCFWRGRTSGNHSNDHEVKEYSNYNSPAKELSQTLRRSFRCIPTKVNQKIPHFPDEPEKTINLTHIVPPTPPPVHNGFNDSSISCRSIGDASSMDSSSITKSPCKLLHGSMDSTHVDEEHRLIARYAARLAADANNANLESLPQHIPETHNMNQSRSPTELNYNLDSNKAQRDLVLQLEAKNREIMHEIQRLRLEQEKQAKVSSEVAGQQRNPTLLAELRLLRQRRDELEARMTALQESRRELMIQLEGLMKLLKNHASPRSTPNSSPRARTHSPPLLPLGGRSTPSTPGDTLAGLGGDVRQAFSHPNGAASSVSSVRSLRNDLLVAADSVTNAMSSLVKELNSEASSGSDEDDEGEKLHNSSTMDELAQFKAEMQQRLQQESDFLRELRARKHSLHRQHSRGSDSEHDHYVGLEDGESYLRTDDESLMMTDDAESYIKTDDEGALRTDDDDAELYDNNPRDLLPHRYTTDEESCLETDQESYIRTDDEEGGNTEWEDAMRRWVNR